MDDPLEKAAIVLALLAGIAAMPEIGESARLLFRLAFASLAVWVMLK